MLSVLMGGKKAYVNIVEAHLKRFYFLLNVADVANLKIIKI